MLTRYSGITWSLFILPTTISQCCLSAALHCFGTNMVHNLTCCRPPKFVPKILGGTRGKTILVCDVNPRIKNNKNLGMRRGVNIKYKLNSILWHQFLKTMCPNRKIQRKNLSIQQFTSTTFAPCLLYSGNN